METALLAAICMLENLCELSMEGDFTSLSSRKRPGAGRMGGRADAAR